MRSETSFALDGDLIVIDAVVIGPSGRANIQLVLDTGAVAYQRQSSSVDLCAVRRLREAHR